MYDAEFVNKVSRYTGKSLAESLAICEQYSYLIDIAEEHFSVVEDIDSVKESAYDDGYQDGKRDGYSEGYGDGRLDGYQEGYDAGVSA